MYVVVTPLVWLPASAPCSAVFWLAAFSGASAIALLPDITHMLFSRYFRPSLSTVLQVSRMSPGLCLSPDRRLCAALQWSLLPTGGPGHVCFYA